MESRVDELCNDFIAENSHKKKSANKQIKQKDKNQIIYVSPDCVEQQNGERGAKIKTDAAACSPGAYFKGLSSRGTQKSTTESMIHARGADNNQTHKPLWCSPAQLVSLDEQKEAWKLELEGGDQLS